MLRYDSNDTIYKKDPMKIDQKNLEERVYLKKKDVNEAYHGQGEVYRRHPRIAEMLFQLSILCSAASKSTFILYL
jgi:hypothetical protein